MAIASSTVVSLKGFYTKITPRLHLHRFAEHRADGRIELTKGGCWSSWGYKSLQPGTRKYKKLSLSEMVAKLAHSVDIVNPNRLSSHLDFEEKINLNPFLLIFRGNYTASQTEWQIKTIANEVTPIEYCVIAKYIDSLRADHATRIFFSDAQSVDFKGFIAELSEKCNARNQAKLKAIQDLFDRKKRHAVKIVDRAQALLDRVVLRQDFQIPKKVNVTLNSRGDVEVTSQSQAPVGKLFAKVGVSSVPAHE